MARAFKTPVTVDGDLSTSGFLKSTNSQGDEGGQLELAKSVTNTTLTTGITLDVFQNKLRIFETGGTNRGYYIDISGGGASVGTNLVGGGGGGSGTVTSITAGTTGLTGGTITTSGTIDIDTAKVPQLTTNTNTFVAGTGATTLIVKQGATQSATNLMEWQNTSASALAIISSAGSIYSSANGGFGSTTPLSTARLSVLGSANSIAVIVRSSATNPGDLQQWQTSTPATVASVSNTGAMTATTYTSSIASGTAPLVVTSPTVVANLTSTYAIRGAIVGNTAPTTATTANMARIYVSNTTPVDTLVAGDIWISF